MLALDKKIWLSKVLKIGKNTDYRVFLRFSFQDPKREENPMFDRFNQDWCPRETRDVLTPKRLWRGLGWAGTGLTFKDGIFKRKPALVCVTDALEILPHQELVHVNSITSSIYDLFDVSSSGWIYICVFLQFWSLTRKHHTKIPS